VVGMARSGIAAARFLARRGARVVANDSKGPAELPAAVADLAGDGVSLALGTPLADAVRGASLVVLSPGVPWDLPPLRAARDAGVEVIGELELGARHIAGPIAAITGTKGKSTTTAALGAMLRQRGGDVRVGGNIGEAVTGLLEGADAQTTFVLEVSSFQLEASDTFHPRVAVFLNLTPDHLDRHASMEEYGQAKARIFSSQTADDWAIVNADDAEVLRLSVSARARRLTFAPTPPAGDGAYLGEDAAYLRQGATETALFRREDVHLPGAHLELDLLAAATAAHLLGASPQDISVAVRNFAGAEHVLERVATHEGVSWFNDSKATNLAAVRKSLDAFPGPVVLILGGRYKGGEFRDLREPLRAHGRAVMAIGEARPLIAAALQDAIPVMPCGSMPDAVARARELAQPGDTVLLAPGCSSFDMFVDYADRGHAFKTAVHALVLAGSR
jgi:UDP-N-acetylmuramoylalanine--D-glutamate ligase